MKKILFFPLLRMPSGHHQVADSLASYLQTRNPEIICKKIDVLSSWNPVVESVVTKTYLEWIYHFPKSYAWVYKQMAHTSRGYRNYRYYEILFLKKMKEIIEEEKPSLIICTHGFPSYLLSRLKLLNQCQIPVINVYTDFFVNDVWGKEGIDFHFAPCHSVKEELLNNGVSEKNIFITGIPTSEKFNELLPPIEKGAKFTVLVSGGSVGLGNILKPFRDQRSKSKVEYFILCGKNKKLYQQIAKLHCENIHPLPYISSKEQMNELYNKADAIITKPGGVTISEALKKRLPIFIHSALPGQEEINLQLLKELKLVLELDLKQPLEEQIENFFNNQMLYQNFKNSLQTYLNETKAGKPDDISDLIHCLMEDTVQVLDE
ncbi:MGDG synthase family glycosyltransferase [Bacillus niameyensis]|uniref:MGDG synthase family glycosyltransferase n=1 Tax=Bacillus niameyensis TaxID=1522308 RepID=UPI000784EF4D|nr:glycosyltransferase [Bacillus niameyensis]